MEEFKRAGVYAFDEIPKINIPQDQETLVFVMREDDWFVSPIRKFILESIEHQPVYIIIQFKDKRIKYGAVSKADFELIERHIRELINKDENPEPSNELEEIKTTIDEQIESLETDMSLLNNLEKEFGDKNLSQVRKLLAKRYEHLCYEDLFPY